MVKHRKRLVVGSVVLLIVFVIGLIAIDKHFTSPANAVVVNSPYPVAKQAALNLTPKSYSDNFVSFNYPTIMTLNQSPKVSPPIIDIASMSYPDSQSWLLTIQIMDIPSGNLYDNSAYQARIINPTVYQLSQSTISGVSVPTFTDKSAAAYNRVSFLVSGEYQAVIALSGNDSSGQTPLANTMTMLLDSWQWQPGY